MAWTPSEELARANAGDERCRHGMQPWEDCTICDNHDPDTMSPMDESWWLAREEEVADRYDEPLVQGEW